LDREASQRHVNNGCAVGGDHYLRVERDVPDLPDTEHVGAGLDVGERERTGDVGELLAAARVQGDDAEAEGLSGFGADDGATEGRLLGRGDVRAYQSEQPADLKAQAAAE